MTSTSLKTSKQHLSNKNKTSLFVVCCAIVSILRLFLIYGIFIKFNPGSGYDDVMQILKALSILNGDWLGTYSSTTLVKGVGFPLITAFFSFIKIPFVLGWNLIYVSACIIFITSINSFIKNKFILFFAYTFLLFNPIAFSTDINRYYRDIGYYAIAFLFISLIINILSKPKGAYSYIFVGISFALCVIMREDFQYLIILLIVSLACIFLMMFIQKKLNYKYILKSSIALFLGFISITLPISIMNKIHYDTYALDEYNSGSYAMAYGALSRLDGGLRDSRIVIPLEERLKLYQNSEMFAELYEQLDAENAKYSQWKEVQGEYLSGYFSFVLRDAVIDIKQFKNAKEADEYYKSFAKEVNDYCDSLPYKVGPARKGIQSRFYYEDIPQIVNSFFKSIALTLKYTNVSAIPEPVDADDKYLAIFENPTNSICAANRYMPNGEIIENYTSSGFALLAYRLRRVTIIVYKIITPVLFILSLLLWIYQSIMFLTKKLSIVQTYCWLCSSSLFATFLVRNLMIAFVDATTFSAISNPCYQAVGYVLIIAFISLQISVFAQYMLDVRVKIKNTI